MPKHAIVSMLELASRPNCARIDMYIRDVDGENSTTVSASLVFMVDGLPTDRVSLARYFRALADGLVE